MRHWLFPILLCLSACGGSGTKDDDTSAAGASGAECNLGSDCSLSEFCYFDFQNGNDPDAGTCIALPAECDGPTSCDDCPELGDAACPDSFNVGCSDSDPDANPIYSCN